MRRSDHDGRLNFNCTEQASISGDQLRRSSSRFGADYFQSFERDVFFIQIADQFFKIVRHTVEEETSEFAIPLMTRQRRKSDEAFNLIPIDYDPAVVAVWKGHSDEICLIRLYFECKEWPSVRSMPSNNGHRHRSNRISR
jgi:hypothetical protein